MKNKWLTCDENNPMLSFLCDGYRIKDIDNFENVMQFYDDLSRKYPKHKLFLTLDDFGQATYTSAHAIETYNLDDTDGHDLSLLDPNAFEDGEHKGYLSTTSEFPIRYHNFMQIVKDKQINDLFANPLSITDEDIEDLHQAHLNPYYILDDTVYIALVPVKYGYENIIALPNGYFSSDLSPIDIYTLSKYFYETYEYDLFSIGASYMGFRAKRDLSDLETKKMIEDLMKLYKSIDGQDLNHIFSEIVGKTPFLFLKYTD